MLILNKGIKDYYDFLCGINGIDKDIVYDRRDCIVLGNSFNTYESCFTKKVLYNDTFKIDKKRWFINEKGKSIYGTIPTGNVQIFIIEVGYTHYMFQVERYLITHDNVQLDVNLIKTYDVKEKKSTAPLSFIPCLFYFSPFSNEIEVQDYLMRFEIKNPILKDTYIPSYILPNEIYDKIYNYLISIREKPIIDKRNDVQKLESHGFDKKHSFRGC